MFTILQGPATKNYREQRPFIDGKLLLCPNRPPPMLLV